MAGCFFIGGEWKCKRCGRMRKVKSRTIPRYPKQAERECVRMVNGYVRVIRNIINKHKGLIRNAYSGDVKESVFYVLGLADKAVAGKFTKNIQMVAKVANRNVTKEMVRSVNTTLGTQLEDSFFDESTRERTDAWVSAATRKMDSIRQNSILGFGNRLINLSIAGKAFEDAWDESEALLEKGFGSMRSSAVNDLTSLTGDLYMEEQQQLGCDSYIWITARDGSVRESHAELDGTECRWDAPPQMWYETKNGIVFTGRYHPGEEYNCRCIAQPVYNMETFDWGIEND